MRLAFAAFLLASLVLATTGAPRAAANRLVGEDGDPWAKSNPEDLRIQLVTFGPGDAIHQYFGHNGMVVIDARRRLEGMYNFGMFGFGPGMLPSYLKGRLEFWGAVTPVEDTYLRYIASNRSVRVLELDLPPAQRMRLAQRLAYYVLPENRAYRYDHYTDNCSTRLRDLLDESIDGQLKAQSAQIAKLNYRGHTARYTEHDPLTNLLLTLWMNDSMERPIREYQEAFLPGELERIVEKAQLRSAEGAAQPLVRTAYTLFEAKRAPLPSAPSPRWPGALVIGAAIGAVAVGLGLWLARTGSTLARVALGGLHTVVGLVLGVPGLVAGLFLLTEWQVTHGNENLFFANPLSAVGFAIGPAFAFGSQRARRTLFAVCAVLAGSTALLIALKALPMFDQQNALPFALYAPINFGFAAAHALLRRAKPAAVLASAATEPSAPVPPASARA
jgi:hypothetical protein